MRPALPGGGRGRSNGPKSQRFRPVKHLRRTYRFRRREVFRSREINTFLGYYSVLARMAFISPKIIAPLSSPRTLRRTWREKRLPVPLSRQTNGPDDPATTDGYRHAISCAFPSTSFFRTATINHNEAVKLCVRSRRHLCRTRDAYLSRRKTADFQSDPTNVRAGPVKVARG